MPIFVSNFILFLLSPFCEVNSSTAVTWSDFFFNSFFSEELVRGVGGGPRMVHMGNVLVVGIDYGLIMAYPIKVMNHPICGISLIKTNFRFLFLFFVFLFAPFSSLFHKCHYIPMRHVPHAKKVRGRIFSFFFCMWFWDKNPLCHET